MDKENTYINKTWKYLVIIKFRLLRLFAPHTIWHYSMLTSLFEGVTEITLRVYSILYKIKNIAFWPRMCAYACPVERVSEIQLGGIIVFEKWYVIGCRYLYSVIQNYVIDKCFLVTKGRWTRYTHTERNCAAVGNVACDQNQLSSSPSLLLLLLLPSRVLLFDFCLLYSNSQLHNVGFLNKPY